MNFKKGHYETECGNKAVVAQIKPVGSNGWILKGAVQHEGCFYMHNWDIEGRSHSGHTSMNLVPNES